MESGGGQTTNSITITTGGIYSVLVTHSNGCSKVSPNFVVTAIANDHIWTGLANTDDSWHNVSNWKCSIPDKTSVVVIPTTPANVAVNGTPNWPEVKAGLIGECKSLTVESSAEITIISTGTLNVNKP